MFRATRTTIASSSRKVRRGSTAGSGGGGYNLANVIAAIRADSNYGTAFTDTSDPQATGGLVLPTAPTTTTTANVSTLAGLTAAITSGVHVTLAPGSYTASGGSRILDIGAVNDVQITLTGCTFTCDKSLAGGGVTIDYRANRIKIVGGTFDAGYQMYGDDLKFENMSFVVATSDSSNANLGIVGGRRIAWEHCTSEMFNGGPVWCDSAHHAQISGTISGTTLTVTSHNGRAIDIGHDLEFIFGNGGVATLRGTRITGFGTGSGGTGTYTINLSQTTTASTNFWVSTRATNIILANSVASARVGTGGSAGLHENMCRFNGSHFGVLVDSRVTSEAGNGGAKPTFRITSNNSTKRQSGTFLALRVQSEGSGFQTVLVNGLYPNVDKFYVDDCEAYRTPASVATNLGPAIDPQPIAEPYLDTGVGEGTSISGNGTTATLTFRSSQAGHGLTNGDVVDIFQALNAAYNATGVTATVVNAYTFTYPSSATGACAALSVRTPYDNCVTYQMWNTNVYSAPDVGTNGAGWTGPSGVDASWSTVTNASTAAANGNFYRTWVTPPAWSFQ